MIIGSVVELLASFVVSIASMITLCMECILRSKEIRDPSIVKILNRGVGSNTSFQEALPYWPSGLRQVPLFSRSGYTVTAEVRYLSLFGEFIGD
jgi:hypothetical protein